MRDPLWFLTRQWQFGEFEGDDAGSPIDARIAYETAPLDGYRSGADILPYDGKTRSRRGWRVKPSHSI